MFGYSRDLVAHTAFQPNTTAKSPVVAALTAATVAVAETRGRLGD